MESKRGIHVGTILGFGFGILILFSCIISTISIFMPKRWVISRCFDTTLSFHQYKELIYQLFVLKQ